VCVYLHGYVLCLWLNRTFSWVIGESLISFIHSFYIIILRDQLINITWILSLSVWATNCTYITVPAHFFFRLFVLIWYRDSKCGEYPILYREVAFKFQIKFTHWLIKKFSSSRKAYELPKQVGRSKQRSLDD